MPSAQVDAWAAVHRGTLSDVSALINGSLADAAIARMMLHRRRATIPKVINEFFGAAGNAFTSDLTDPAPQAAADFSSEIAAAKAAGLVAEGACGDAPPLLFERALLAEMEGRRGDALADLRRLLDSYPGFVAAAFAAARVALEDNDPMGAIVSLAYVERELFQTREGAALLADALRAVGMHEAASRYDLAALRMPARLTAVAMIARRSTRSAISPATVACCPPFMSRRCRAAAFSTTTEACTIFRVQASAACFPRCSTALCTRR